MAGDQKYEIMAKGFLNAINEFGEIQANDAKIKTDIMANQFKQQNNFLWKQKEREAERTSKLKHMQDFISQQGGNAGGLGSSPYPGSKPRIRVGASGDPTIHYSSQSEEFNNSLQQSSKKIQTGESDSKTELNYLRGRYPGKISATIEYNFNKVGRESQKKLKAQEKEYSKQAKQMLIDKGYPVTRNNINSIIEQLKNKSQE